MSAVENWSVLSKSSIDNTHYVPVTGKRKFQLVQLLPSLTTVGTGGQTIYDGITFGNQLNMKGLKSATPTMLALATNAGNVEFTILPAGIDLNACDNTTSLFLKVVDLAANVGATILPFANGGTGLSSIAKGQILYASAADTLSATSALSTNGQLLIGNATSGIPTVANLTAGANVTITNGAGTITIAANLSALSAVLDTDIYNINLNAAAGTSWISGDGTNEGVTVDANGRVFIGDSTPTLPALVAQLTLGGAGSTALQIGNQSSYGGRTIKVTDAPSSTNGAALTIEGADGGSGNQNGGDILVYAGGASGSGTGGNAVVRGGHPGSSGTGGGIRFQTSKAAGAGSDAALIDPDDNFHFVRGHVRYTQNPQNLTGAGAVSTPTQLTYVNTTGANALTLADGVQGQTKQIVMRQDLGDATLTPTNLAGASTITFNDVGDTVSLMFLDGEWHIMGYYGVTIA
jgi:hypothetical protein